MLQSLVNISPTDVLTFELARDTAPKTVLRVSNTSNSKIAFKVKTTEPTWYYVRPNQHVLDIGEHEDVVIVLVEAECNRFIEQGDGNKAIANHRFLVQSRPIDDTSFTAIVQGSQAQKATEFTTFWGSAPKENRKNHKLKVEYSFPNAHNPLPTVHEGAELESPIAANVDSIRDKLMNDETMGAAPMAHEGAAGSPEALLAELQSLRKKYDAIVEYTVHLTAERDYHFSQSEEKRNAEEKLREKSKKKSADNVPKLKSGDKLMDKKTNSVGGISPMIVIVVAFLFFFLGRWVTF